jgi:hypothetical protein
MTPLLAVLRDLMAWLKAGKVQGVVIGGLAASLWGRDRLTREVDVLMRLEEARWTDFLHLGTQNGFAPQRAEPAWPRPAVC